MMMTEKETRHSIFHDRAVTSGLFIACGTQTYMRCLIDALDTISSMLMDDIYF
jgi:hypothetical protein